MRRPAVIAAVGAMVFAAGCAGARPLHVDRTSPSTVRASASGTRNLMGAVPTRSSTRTAAAACDAKSLRVHAGRESDGSSFAAAANVEITNVGRVRCRLGGAPTVRILTATGARLHVRYVVTHHAVLRSVVLPAGKRAAAAMRLVWLNWCGAAPDRLRIEIALAHSRGAVSAEFSGPPGYGFVPHCASPQRGSTLELLAAYARDS